MLSGIANGACIPLYMYRLTLSIYLPLSDPPSITQSPLSQTAHLNSLVQFHCAADGNPDPLISWNFQGTPIPEVQEGILTIPSATEVDVGVYTCTAANTVGQDTADASLIILCEWHIHLTTIECPYTSVYI